MLRAAGLLLLAHMVAAAAVFIASRETTEAPLAWAIGGLAAWAFVMGLSVATVYHSF